ncbi:MAG: hypothetical protein MK289_18365 [Trichodesmium sp. ALOHA_ZT_67]|nr:hypothetical protein [Trichodesmium sp. ALOHA_ZT_67]MDT9338393.1 hypothetical protein [Trichodesmium erythraeum 21-75]
MKKKRENKQSPGQMWLPWATWEPVESEVMEVTRQFVLAKCYDPEAAMLFFDDFFMDF